MEVAAFYVLASITVGSALLVVTLRNLFHSVLALVLSFFGVAAFYILLNADFVAATQILIYVGAIVTLAIFAIMLTSKIFNKETLSTNEQVFPTLFVCLSLFILLATTLTKTPWKVQAVAKVKETTEQIGQLLLGRFLLPFEVVSLVLLAALIGAIVIAKEE